jgi:hypothetical protein
LARPLHETNIIMRTSFILGSVGLVAVLGLAGCAADNESEGGDLAQVPHSAPGQAVGDKQPDEQRFSKAGPTYPSVDTNPAGFTCRAGAFCETFEAPTYVDNWSAAFTSNDGELVQTTASASVGNGSLRATTRDKDSTAYLLREKNLVGSQWSGSLGFAIRVPTLPTGSVGGPELMVKTAIGPIYVRVLVTPDGLYLEQNGTSECSASRCTGSRTFISNVLPNHWYSVTVGLEVNSQNTAPYGLIETSVNGGEFVTSDLTVPLTDGQVFLKAGITQGDPGAYATIDLDDVSLLVR